MRVVGALASFVGCPDLAMVHVAASAVYRQGQADVVELKAGLTRRTDLVVAVPNRWW